MTDTDRMLTVLRLSLDRAEYIARRMKETSERTGNDGVRNWGMAGTVLRQFLDTCGPDAVLRRIAADRQLLDEHADDGYGECKTCSIPDGTVEVNGIEYEMLAHAPAPCGTIRNLAEGWGWTEETSSE